MAEQFDPRLPTPRGLATGRLYPRGSEGQAPPEFGIRGNRVGSFSITLGANTEALLREFGGTALWCVAGTDIDTFVNVRFQEEHASLIPFRPGMMIQGLPFSRLYFDFPQQLDASSNPKTISFIFLTEEDPVFRVTNPFALGQQVTVVGTTSVSVSTAIPISTISADNSWKQRTNDGVAWYSGGTVQGTLAAHIPQHQLIVVNTPIAGKTSLIRRWVVSTDVAQILELRTPPTTIFGSSVAFQNKILGGGTGQTTYVIGTAALPAGGPIAYFYAPANTPIEIALPQSDPWRFAFGRTWLLNTTVPFCTLNGMAEVVEPAE